MRTTARRALPPQVALPGVAFAFGIVMVGTTLPTPLYPLYEQLFSFSNLMTTLIYAVYATGVLAALMLLGRASDSVGRRPMLLAGLAAAAASGLVFLLGTGPAILFAGRVLSGVSAGIFTGTATVAIIELARPELRPRAALVATTVNMLGLGFGPLLAGFLAAWAPAPLRLPYAAHLALLVLAFAAVWLMPETVGHVRRRLPPPQRLSVPHQARAAFLPAALVGFAAFSVFGLLTAIEPAILRQLLDDSSPALAGLLLFSMFAGSALGQVSLARFTGPAALPTGCLVLLAGLAAFAGSLLTASLAALVVTNVVVGVGHGITFRAAVAAITAASPPDRRAEAMSTFFVIGYVGLSLPVVLVGLLATAWDLRSASLVFAAAIAALTLAAVVTLVRLGRRARGA
ncbi:MFS transporter [Pseudactinotalea sp. HY158]|uniref:MFS transporter n=1 Tax=unclassified Pseudactinotalea TaxID=2649176 RepID=UPI001E49CE57|nr:MFS transporter [Pseudactinotalea sp. HY158]